MTWTGGEVYTWAVDQWVNVHEFYSNPISIVNQISDLSLDGKPESWLEPGWNDTPAQARTPGLYDIIYRTYAIA